MIYTRDDINQLNSRERAHLINSASGYKSANLLATKSKHGQTNVAVFSSVVHFGAHPPILGFVLRPTSVSRHTYNHIKETGVYTINHIHQSIIKDAHHTSAKYAEHISEFDRTNLEEEYLESFYAPYVKDCPVKIGMHFLEEHYIKANDTRLILGEVDVLHVSDHLLSVDGFIDLSIGETAVITGLDGYSIPNGTQRFSYQTPLNNIL